MEIEYFNSNKTKATHRQMKKQKDIENHLNSAFMQLQQYIHYVMMFPRLKTTEFPTEGTTSVG